MSASFDLELGAAIRASASGAGQSVSAWLAETARARLRLEALAAAVTAWEQDFGPLIEAEVHDADRVLGQAAQRRRKGVA